MKRGFLVALLGALLMHAIVDAQQATVNAPQATSIKFFKNYFVTGDYVVGGVNLRGKGVSGIATDNIQISGVPDGADIVAAFLYWETVLGNKTSDLPIGANFDGHPLVYKANPTDTNYVNLTFIINPDGTAPCWSSGGATGAPEGAHVMKVYRADVLRFLPIDPVTHKRQANGAHAVALPDAGSGNVVPSTAGASLVVIYKDLGATAKLRSIVIYNGGYTMDQSSQLMNRTLTGFYDAGNGGIPADANTPPVTTKMTHIVGDGSSKPERLLFDAGDTATDVVATNPFQGSASASGDPAWDNYTFFPTVPVHTSSVTTTVDHQGFTTFDCLSWGAIVFSTTVQDTDNDGLVDVWETGVGPTHTPVIDPNGQALPDLYSMGANPTVKDIFIEVGAMKADAAYAAPLQGTVGIHNHMPFYGALKRVGDAFRNAPTRINVHFDVGSLYQTQPLLENGNTYNPVADGYIVPAAGGLARGGELIDETAECPTCLFPYSRGVVGWKTGFRALRDQILVPDDPNTPGDETVRRFDHNRKDIFHYALFAHSLGVQRLNDPNTPADESVAPFDTDANGTADVVVPVPSGVSGTADGGGSGGGDLMVTLGFFDNFVGTEFIQASTLMHELGHNLRLRHGSVYVDPVTTETRIQPNCKPNYESVMNYLFQIRGLIIGTANVPVSGNVVGEATIDYSRQVLGGLDERTPANLSEPLAGLFNYNPSTSTFTTLNYRTRWFSPTNFLNLDIAPSPATRHCDGSFLGAGEVGYFRVDGTTVTPKTAATPTGGIDWNANGTIDAAAISQDVTFSGTYQLLDPGADDWAAIDLRQVGSRRNVASLGGPLSIDQGQGDNGQGDNGQGDNGQGDNGQGDNGQGDNGQGDNGQGDNGQGDNGAPPEMDIQIAKSLGNSPNALKAAIVNKDIQLTWLAPYVGSDRVHHYEVWRVIGQTIDATTWPSRVMVGTTNALTFTDFSAKNNVFYTYAVQAVFDENQDTVADVRSSLSNYATIKK